MLERSSQDVAQLLKKLLSAAFIAFPLRERWDERVFKQYIQWWHIPFTGSDFFCRRTDMQIFWLHYWFELVDHRLWKIYVRILCVFTPTSGKQVGKSKKLWNNFHLGWFVFYEKPLKNFILYHLNHSQNYHGRQQHHCFVNKMYQKGWLWTRKSSRNLNPSYSSLNILTI